MNNFFKNYKKTNRNIVLHDISNFSYCDVIDILENDDILFLDDCTYHQYDFIKCKKTYILWLQYCENTSYSVFCTDTFIHQRVDNLRFLC